MLYSLCLMSLDMMILLIFALEYKYQDGTRLRKGEKQMRKKSKCSMCKSKAFISLKYAGIRLCKEHFKTYFINRVAKTIKKYQMIKHNEKILIGVSGGKDSIAMLHALTEILKDTNELMAVHIDLGINEYSTKSREIFNQICSTIKIENKVISIKEKYGFTINEAVRKIRRPPCSICGLIKRRILNEYALEINADKIATGHTLDDEVTFLMLNYINGNINMLLKRKPHLPKIHEKLIARIKPLCEISDLETQIYCLINNLKYIEIPCPYAQDSPILKFKKIIMQLEEIRPGTKLSLLRNFTNKIYKALESHYSDKVDQKINECIKCGYPTSQDLCAFCRLKEKVLS